MEMKVKFGSGERKSDAWWDWHIFPWRMEEVPFILIAIILLPIYLIYVIVHGVKWLWQHTIVELVWRRIERWNRGEK